MESLALSSKTVLNVPRRPRRGASHDAAQVKGLQPLPARNRVDAVLDQLTQAILNEEMKPGSLLPPERDLAQHLDVSRTVVREAIRTLQSRGMVEIRQGLGTVVVGVSSEPMQQMFSHALHGSEESLLHLTEVRLSLEVKIAEWAATRATAENVTRLQELFDGMSQSLNESQRFADLDVEFHLELARATQNPLFVLMLESVSVMLHQSRELTLAAFPDKGAAKIAQKAHAAILDAIKAKDGAGAAQAMSGHLDLQRQDFEQLLHVPVK